MRELLSTFLVLIFFVACQAKEGSGSLVSGHRPATNSFTVDTPAADTYVAGDVINLSVTFPFDLIIDTTGGNPQLNITIGSTSRIATYSAGTDPRKLNFTYTVVGGDNDSNGITVNSLSLNGSTLQWDNQGTLTNASVSSLVAKTLTSTRVDTTGPTITAFALTNVPGMYNAGEDMSFIMTFSEAVTVTGTPKFVTTLSTGGAVDTNYISGNGTTILRFEFTITSSHADADGFGFTSPLDVGAGSIEDAYGNAANLSFAGLIAAVVTYSQTTRIGGQYPYVENITLPANGTYNAGSDLDFILDFDRNVNVTATPYLGITIGSNTRQAQYISGSGTSTLTFRYTVIPGDVDADGITVPTSITQNTGGDIRDAAGATLSYFADALNNSFTVPTTAGIICNAIQPMATTVTRNADTTTRYIGTAVTDNVWNLGQVLYLNVGFNTPVYVNQTGGTPTLSMTIGATTREATYLSGGNGSSTLVFSYTVQEGDLDTDGNIALNSIVLNNGVITDAENTNILLTLPVANLASTQIDGVRPTILTVSAPTNGTYSSVAPLNNMPFVITWNEAVNYSSTAAAAAYFPIDIGGTNVNAIYAGGNNSATVTHNVNFSGKNDSNGVTVSSPFSGTGTVRDSAGNIANVFTFTPPDTSLVFVDTTAPTVTSVTQTTPNGTYNTGDNLDFLVTFSESVTTLVAGGYPRIPISVGATTRYLTPTANSTGTTHTFRYTIVAGELDTNGVIVGNFIGHNSTTAYARDAGRNNSTGTFTPPNTASLLVDAVAPTVTSVTKTANGTYENPSSLQISIQYSEAVTVTGTPRIQLSLASGTLNLNYSSGSGTTTLIFSGTLAATDYDFDGLPSSVNTIDLNGGTILDAGGNAVPGTFTAQNFSSIFAVYPTTDLWVTSNFTSLAPAGNPTVSNSGAITTEACGIGTCRTFTGDDSLNLTSALNNVQTVFIVVKIPAAAGPGDNFDIFDADVTLTSDFIDGNYDLSTANATVTVNGSSTSGTTHELDLAPGSVQILQIDFAAPQSYGAVTLIESAFTGAIGEVIAVTGALTGPQKTNIYNYLDAKY